MIQPKIKPPAFSPDWTNGVSMIVPTFKRPRALKTALESLKVQSAGHRPLELIVSDNDPDASAKNYVRQFAATAPFPVIYVHAKRAGVANARNKALQTARGRYLAFLDDDQVATKNWLTELLKVMDNHKAGLAFCAIHAKSAVNIRHKPQFLDFFSRDMENSQSGPVEEFFGCGSSLLDRKLCDLPSPPFSTLTNETGGEDDLLFSQLKARGNIIAWTNQTSVDENVEDWRMSRKYIRLRSFAYGQGPSRICADPDNFDLLGVMRWTVIGAGQFCIFAPLAIAARAVRHKSSIHFMRKACEGAGKVLWYQRFRPKIYGATALKQLLQRERTRQKKAGIEAETDVIAGPKADAEIGLTAPPYFN